MIFYETAIFSNFIIRILYYSIHIKSNNVIDETQTIDSLYLENEFNDNTWVMFLK